MISNIQSFFFLVGVIFPMEALFHKTEVLSIMLWESEKENMELKKQIEDLKAELCFSELELRETQMVLENSNISKLEHTIRCLMDLNKALIASLSYEKEKYLEYEFRL